MISYMPRPRKLQDDSSNDSGALVGARIKKTRLTRGLSQAQLAEMIGLSREAITAYESGRMRLLDDMVAKIARALSVSADELLGLKKSETTTPYDTPSVQIARRMQRIKRLPLAEQKVILKNIDMFLKAAESEEVSSS